MIRRPHLPLLQSLTLAISLVALGCPTSDDDDATGDDDTSGDDDATGDDDTTGDDDATGDDDTTEAVDADGDGYTAEEDCDDGDPNSYPGADELCDGLDNDCDGLVPDDEADADGDGISGCDGDCDDADPANYPGNAEACDGTDNDCDGVADNGLTVDADGDGHSTPDSCEGTQDDCDDADPANFPGNAEVCDGNDNDCDDEADEGLTFDADGDGHSTPDSCEGTPVDCAAGDAPVFPGAEELCDEVDQDCDGDPGLDDCEDCGAILVADPTAADGIYTIDLDGVGVGAPFDVYCDMTTHGGGWTLWWWFEAGSDITGVDDVLADDLAGCDPSLDTACYATLPVPDPAELLVANDEGSWAVWEFDASTTSTHALAAFTLGTEIASGICNDAWNPVEQHGAMTDDPYHCDETNNDGGNCRCFWYYEYNGVWSFYLDDDSGWAETAFGAGYDNAGYLGIDSLELAYRYHDNTRSLWMYWR